MRRCAGVLLAIISLIQRMPSGVQAEATSRQRTVKFQTPDPGPTQFLGVSILPGTTGKTLIDLSITRATSYHLFQLKNPARLVLDLEQARMARPQKFYVAQSPLLREVRVSQFRSDEPAIVRVVADLSGDPKFEVHAQPGGLRVELEPRPPVAVSSRDVDARRPLVTTPTPGAVHPTERKPSTSPLQVGGAKPDSAQTHLEALPTLGYGRRNEGHQDALLALLAPREYNTMLGGKELSDKTLAAASTSRLSTAAALPGKQLPGQAHATEGAQVVAGASQGGPASSGSSMRVPSQPSNAASSAGAANAVPITNPARGGDAGQGQQGPKYTGEPISLNLKDVDLKDFFRLIHEVSGLNILVDPDVSGTLTLVLDNVPWDQALDIVLRNNGLVRVTEGSLVRIAKQPTITAEQEAAARLEEAKTEAAPLVTVFRPLRYAQSVTRPIVTPGATPIPGVVDILKGLAGAGVLSKRGSVTADPRNNTVIITDISSQIPILDSVIAKLDRKSSQVSIEARIVRANSDFARTLSSVLSASLHNASGSTQQSGATGVGIIGTATPNPPLPAAPVFMQPPSIPASGFGVYAIMNSGSRYIINAAIAAAETRDQAKVISAPSIVTQNNVLGEVLQGVQIPVQTTINNTISVTYVNATLTLDVTPQVTEDGNIFLSIKVQNAVPGAVLTVNAPAPSINTQAATTQVLVPDGGTVVFGGVKVTNRTRSVTQVPLLGSIPILGNLFKSSEVTDNDQELLFFITPKVLPG